MAPTSSRGVRVAPLSLFSPPTSLNSPRLREPLQPLPSFGLRVVVNLARPVVFDQLEAPVRCADADRVLQRRSVKAVVSGRRCLRNSHLGGEKEGAAGVSVLEGGGGREKTWYSS